LRQIIDRALADQIDQSLAEAEHAALFGRDVSAHDRARYPRRLPEWRRVLPSLTAAVLAAGYLVASPRSPDLAAQLFRVKLFAEAGLVTWDNWWYAGHYTLPYSVLFPPLAWLFGPRVLVALAAVGAAAAFESLANRHFGRRAWLGATWFGAATVTPLLSGRLTFAAGLFPVALAALALQRRRPGLAAGAALATALFSPVAALFAALAGLACGLGGTSRSARRGGLAIAAAALAPVVTVAAVFPGPGTEPFAFSALWPILVIAAAGLAMLPRRERTLTAAIALYALGCIAAYATPTPVGGNATRLGVLVAGPLAALVAWPRHRRLLAVAALPLLYLQWQAPVRDVITAQSDPSTQTAYYRPLINFLRAQPHRPFRLEIPFTRAHWEAYEVAPYVPLARGWERQTDRGVNALFYDRRLTEAAYDAWLHALAVRYVALPDAPLDPSSRREAAIIQDSPPFLHLVRRTAHWRIYAVARPTALATGAAMLTHLGVDTLTLTASRPGTTLVRVRYSPYWHAPGVTITRSGPFLEARLPHRGRFVLRNGL